jgi:thiol-disulfide isomerase/thioredoxin
MRTLLRIGLAAAAVALAGCGGADRHATQAPAAGAATAVAVDSTGALRPIDGRGVMALVSDGRARVTIVNLWATWCMPCREEFPELLAAANAHRADGVRLLLVSTDFEEQANEVRRFLARNAVTDTTYLKHDGDQTFIDTINPEWTGTIPATLVYDASGRRVAFWEGRADRARFESAIRRALGAPLATDKEKPS